MTWPMTAEQAVLHALRLAAPAPLWLHELHRATGRDSPTLHKALQKLLREGLVTGEREELAADAPANRWPRRYYRLRERADVG